MRADAARADWTPWQRTQLAGLVPPPVEAEIEGPALGVDERGWFVDHTLNSGRLRLVNHPLVGVFGVYQISHPGGGRILMAAADRTVLSSDLRVALLDHVCCREGEVIDPSRFDVSDLDYLSLSRELSWEAVELYTAHIAPWKIQLPDGTEVAFKPPTTFAPPPTYPIDQTAYPPDLWKYQVDVRFTSRIVVAQTTSDPEAYFNGLQLPFDWLATVDPKARGSI